MLAEVSSTIHFLGDLLKRKSGLTPEAVVYFSAFLQDALTRHYRDHWFPDSPLKGSGYRCIRINGILDPLVAKAGECAGLARDRIHSAFPEELTIWVDPGEVLYRIGENGSVGRIYPTVSALSTHHNGKTHYNNKNHHQHPHVDNYGHHSYRYYAPNNAAVTFNRHREYSGTYVGGEYFYDCPTQQQQGGGGYHYAGLPTNETYSYFGGYPGGDNSSSTYHNHLDYGSTATMRPPGSPARESDKVASPLSPQSPRAVKTDENLDAVDTMPNERNVIQSSNQNQNQSEQPLKRQHRLSTSSSSPPHHQQQQLFEGSAALITSSSSPATSLINNYSTLAPSHVKLTTGGHVYVTTTGGDYYYYPTVSAASNNTTNATQYYNGVSLCTVAGRGGHRQLHHAPTNVAYNSHPNNHLLSYHHHQYPSSATVSYASSTNSYNNTNVLPPQSILNLIGPSLNKFYNHPRKPRGSHAASGAVTSIPTATDMHTTRHQLYSDTYYTGGRPSSKESPNNANTPTNDSSLTPKQHQHSSHKNSPTPVNSTKGGQDGNVKRRHQAPKNNANVPSKATKTKVGSSAPGTGPTTFTGKSCAGGRSSDSIGDTCSTISSTSTLDE